MITEHVWTKAEQDMARRERNRLIRARRIKFRALPNVLIKTADGWQFPSLKGA